MTRTRQSLRYKILLGVMCAVLGHLGVFNTSASAQRYMFGRADFAAASQDQRWVGSPRAISTAMGFWTLP